jgi:uncharacterized protein
MRLLIFSDIHSDATALAKLMETEADYYFAAGDLVNWARGFEKAGPVLQRRGDRMYVIPGNHELESDIARFCERYGFHNFHGQTMRAGGYTIGGLGYSNPTPFNTPGEYTEERCADSSSASNRNTSSAGTSTKPWGHRSRWGSRRRTTWARSG